MKLFEARARRRKTQWDLSIRTGVHQSKLSLIERGYIIPTEKEKTKIARSLDFEVRNIEWPKITSRNNYLTMKGVFHED